MFPGAKCSPASSSGRTALWGVRAVAVLGLSALVYPLFGMGNGAPAAPDTGTGAVMPPTAPAPSVYVSRSPAPVAPSRFAGPVMLPAVPNAPLPATVPPAVVVSALPPLVIDPNEAGPGAIRPVALRQPDPKADPKVDPKVEPKALPLPAPNPLFGDDKTRLPRMGGGVLGATPIPTEKDLEEYRQFIEGVIDPRNTLDLIVGRARLVLLKTPPTRTQIADPNIASFRLIEPAGTQMTILGTRVGTTVLNLWFPDPKEKGKEKILSYLVRVFPDPEEKERLETIYKVLEIEINKAFPQSRVRLTLVGDKLMVSGQAHDVYEATQILRILRANAPGAQGAGGGGAVRTPATSPTPTGQPFDPLRPAETPGASDFQTAGGPLVINNLRVPGEQQIMLRVVVAEVNRAAARSIGLNFSITNNRGTTVFAQSTGGLIAAGAGAGAAGLVNLPINLDNGQIPIALNALRTLNYARSLAEPNLTTMNGQTATFLAGGQFPVPVLGGFGTNGVSGQGGLQGVQFVPFGVQLAFSPIITDRDRIRLTLNATVSTRDNAAATNIGGANVPGLNTRTFSTTVELREGQTMAVAGLIQNNIGATGSRVPFLGDIPYLGRFASYHQTSAGEQELIVLVTPELVHPLEPNELGPLPGADVFEPGDWEFYLAGRLESRRAYDYRSTVMTDVHRMLRYRRCEQVYITGPSGHVDPPVPAVVPAGRK